LLGGLHVSQYALVRHGRRHYSTLSTLDKEPMRTLNAHEAADLLHMNVKRVQSLARAGKLPAVRIGRRWLFRSDEIERLLGAPPATVRIETRTEERPRE